MSITYDPTTIFVAKDSLPANHPSKVVRGSEFTTEFTAIQAAFTLAAPADSPVFTGTATFSDLTTTDLTAAAATVTGVLNVNTELDATLVTAASAAVGAGGLTVLGASNVTGTATYSGPVIASGGLTTSTFTSTGIDDNATSTAITVNASGAVKFENAVVENQHHLTGTVIDPANGTIQYKTISGDTTFTESLADGEYVTLMLGNVGTSIITWPTVVWVGGNPPTLEATGFNVIELWHVNSVLYGSFVGAAYVA